MQERNISINRNYIRLIIKQLLKSKVAENNPHIIEYMVNKVMDSSTSTDLFFCALAGEIKDNYRTLGDVVSVKLDKVRNWSNKALISQMLENPSKYGINVEKDSIECIVVEQYFYSEYPKYCVIHPMLTEAKGVVEQKLDIRETDILTDE